LGLNGVSFVFQIEVHYFSLSVVSPHGSHQADSEEEHGGQGAKEAAGDEGGAQVTASDGRREEAAPVPSGDGRAAGDPAVPEVH